MVTVDPQQAWSERKAQILTAYVERFCASLSLSTPVALVDGDAGPASYGAGRWQVPGAPIVAAEHVAALAGRSGRPMRCLSVAAPDDAATLGAALAALGERARVWPGAWGERGAELIRDLGASAAFVLLDTPALTPIAGGLEHLARRLPKTEVLVRYSRAAVAALLEALADEEQARPAEQQLSRLFGTRTWRGVADGASGQDERDRQLRDLYAQQLTELGGGRFKWAAAYPVRTSWGAAEYDLVFATPDRAAGAAMSAVLYAVEGGRDEQPATALLARSAGRPQQASLFEAAPPSARELREHKVAAVAADLRVIADTQPRLWSYADLFDQILRGGWFGQITAEHMVAACALLQREGRLQRVSQGKQWAEKTLLRLVASSQ